MLQYAGIVRLEPFITLCRDLYKYDKLGRFSDRLVCRIEGLPTGTPTASLTRRSCSQPNCVLLYAWRAASEVHDAVLLRLWGPSDWLLTATWGVSEFVEEDIRFRLRCPCTGGIDLALEILISSEGFRTYPSASNTGYFSQDPQLKICFTWKALQYVGSERTRQPVTIVPNFSR